MKTMGVSQFKTKALKILDQVAKTQEKIVITSRGKPWVQISPCASTSKSPEPGRLAHTLVFEDDVVSGFGEEIWDVCQ